MKKIAYALVFLLELLVRCRLVGGTVVKVKCELNITRASCYPSTERAWVDLVMDFDDPTLYDNVTGLALVSPHPLYQTWLFNNENMLTRFTKLTNFHVRGQLKVDVNKSSTIETQLFNFPAMNSILFISARGNIADVPKPGFTLPQNLSQLTFMEANPDVINWKTQSRLVNLVIDGNSPWVHVPEFFYPWLERLDLSEATYVNFTIPNIGFLCRLKRFTFQIGNLLKDPCRCKLMQTWEEYLKNEGAPLSIDIGLGAEKPFNTTNCNPNNVACPDSENILQESKDRRSKCIEMMFPDPTNTPPPTLNPNNTTPSSTLNPNDTTPSSTPSSNPSVDPTKNSLLIYIIIGLLIAAAVLIMVALLAYKYFSSEKELSESSAASGASAASAASSEDEMSPEELQVEETQVEETKAD